MFEEGEPALPEWEIRRARALALRLDRSLAKTPEDIVRAVETLRSLEPMLADDPEVFAMLAWLAGQQKDSAALEKAARRTLELNPDRYEAQEQLLQTLLNIRRSSPVCPLVAPDCPLKTKRACATAVSAVRMSRDL